MKQVCKMVPCVLMALLLVPTVLLSSCAPHESTEKMDAGNDKAHRGDYEKFDPERDAEETAGGAMDATEEDKLQQERVAGGSIGGVVSENLDPLQGITDPYEGEYIPAYGDLPQPPEISHYDRGSDCLSCHAPGGTGTVEPESHISAGLASDSCSSCHQSKDGKK